MKRLPTHFSIAGAAMALVVAACGGADTPEPASPASSEAADSTDAEASHGADDAPDAVAQADRGAAVYDAACGFCHGDAGEGAGNNPPVVGDGVLDGYADAAELLAYVIETMPADDPGGLTAEEFQDVVAFMLQANGIELEGRSITPAAGADITF